MPDVFCPSCGERSPVAAGSSRPAVCPRCGAALRISSDEMEQIVVEHLYGRAARPSAGAVDRIVRPPIRPAPVDAADAQPPAPNVKLAGAPLRQVE
jgi:hypothetical protein